MQNNELKCEDEVLLIDVSKDHILPEGKYMLVEYYCDNPQCDCNSGAFLMVKLDANGKETQDRIALMDYTWNEAVSTLNPSLAPQFIGSKLAEAGLNEFKKLLLNDDDGSVMAIIKHGYAKTREVYKNRYTESPRLAPIQNTNKIGRNDACPCGSGKKYKKCCLVG